MLTNLLYAYLNWSMRRIPHPQPLPDMTTTISDEAIRLILDAEGLDQPWRWPGGGSGITLGHGSDIGADPDSLEHWRGVLADTEIHTLSQAKGITGRRAKQIETRFRGINVSKAQAQLVFSQRTLPIEINRTLKAFPGIELMPPPVLGALVSLVYNRGASITDGPGSTRRREMRIIHEILAEFQTFSQSQRDACQREYALKIAVQFRKMCRLWVGMSLPGLLVRRENEARMIEEAVL